MKKLIFFLIALWCCTPYIYYYPKPDNVVTCNVTSKNIEIQTPNTDSYYRNPYLSINIFCNGKQMDVEYKTYQKAIVGKPLYFHTTAVQGYMDREPIRSFIGLLIIVLSTVFLLFGLIGFLVAGDELDEYIAKNKL